MSANQVVQAKDTRPCITVIGMAGAGKSTVGKMLALSLNWAFVDTDHIIEATYATRLQDVADKLTKDEFGYRSFNSAKYFFQQNRYCDGRLRGLS